ncbi:hypothetical protein BJX96DRAFT_43918 [Aspergillus floccosus]
MCGSCANGPLPVRRMFPSDCHDGMALAISVGGRVTRRYRLAISASLIMLFPPPQLLMWHDEPRRPFAADLFQLIFHACRRIIPHVPPLVCRVHFNFHVFIWKDDRTLFPAIGRGRYRP